MYRDCNKKGMRLGTILQIWLAVLMGGLAILLAYQDKIVDNHNTIPEKGILYVKSMHNWFGTPVVETDEKDTVYLSKPLDTANVGGNISMVYQGMKYEFLVTAKRKYIKENKN